MRSETASNHRQTYRNANFGLSIQYPSQNPVVLFVPLQKSFIEVMVEIKNLPSHSTLFSYIRQELKNKTNTIENLNVFYVQKLTGLWIPCSVIC